MPYPGLDALSVVRLTRIANKFVDVRDRGVRQYRHQRLNRNPATRDDITASFWGRVMIADLVGLDHAAGTYSDGSMTFRTYNVPKIKIGRQFSETNLDELQAIMDGRITNESRIMDFIAPHAKTCVEGCRLRSEALYVAMLRDRLDYDRLGYKASGSLWGMPADLNVTSNPTWKNKTTAKPITEITSLLRLARIKYGVDFNRLEMSTAAFQAIVATDEFKSYSEIHLPKTVVLGTNLSVYQTGTMTRLLETAISGYADGGYAVTVVLNDDRYNWKEESGKVGSSRLQPINEVYLTSSAHDHDDAFADIGEMPTVESALVGLPGTSVLGADGAAAALSGRRGLISYMTVPPDMNPPSATFWAASVEFPRKHHPAYSAKINIGPVSDDIPITDIDW